MNHNILPCILTACSFALNVNGQEMTNGNLIEEACFKNRAGFNIIEYVYDACGNVVGRRKKLSRIPLRTMMRREQYPFKMQTFLH